MHLKSRKDGASASPSLSGRASDHLLGLLIFSEPLDFYVLVGGGLIIAAVTFISYREARLNSKSKTPIPVVTKN